MSPTWTSTRGRPATATDDTYYNSGQGWLPIGATAGSDTSAAYTGKFNGGTSTIANLHVNRSGASTVAHAGLFARLSSAAEVTNLRLEGVSVTVATNATAATPADVFAGGIAGKSAATITGSHVLGAVKSVQSEVTNQTNEKNAYAGGLVGHNTGSITSSYVQAEVTAEQKSRTASLSAYAGGIAGYQDTGGSITASYSLGAMKAESKSNSGPTPYVGGLLGYQNAGSVTATYSYASARADTEAPGAVLTVGGLVGRLQAGSIIASYSTGAPTAGGGTGATKREGGLVGHKNTTGTTVTNSYWDTEKSLIAATSTGTGKTTSELQSPTAYGAGSSIYANWNLDLDNADNDNDVTTGTDDPWDFGTASQYPVLKYRLNTAGQRVTITITATPAVIWERALSASQVPGNTARVNAADITASLSEALLNDVVVTLSTSTAYTLSTTHHHHRRREHQPDRVGDADGGQQLHRRREQGRGPDHPGGRRRPRVRHLRQPHADHQ